MSDRSGAPPLVLHVVFRFATGGLENGVVNLINHMPADRFRHAVLALDTVDPAFARRIDRPEVRMLALHKPPGHSWSLFPRFRQLLRELQPSVVHTRNLAALEFQLPAAWHGVPVRVHGEHGRDMGDLQGLNRRLQWVRRLHAPLVHRYVALSKDLEQYLVRRVGISPARVEHICNGVDAVRFAPAGDGATAALAGSPFQPPQHWLIGTVGRMQQVKNQPLLARAFARMLELAPTLRDRVRLVFVGEGPLRAETQAVLDACGLSDLAWFAGERTDVADVMRGLNCFVLPSLAEGISNTILEAMSSGLPVVATDVGGNADLVATGSTGRVVPSGDVDAMASAMLDLATHPEMAADMGRAGRDEVERRFSLTAMVGAYQAMYEGLLAARAGGRSRI